MNPGLRTNIIQQTSARERKTLKNTEFPEALNYKEEHRRKDRRKS